MTTIPQRPREDLIQSFTRRAKAVAAIVSVAADVEELAGIVAAGGMPSATGLHTMTRAVLSAYPSLAPALSQHGLQVRIAEDLAEGQSPAETAALLAGDVGLIVAEAGVAETGSFLSADDTLAARLLGMVADSVFAIVPEERLMATLDEMGELLSRLSAEGNRYLSLVTGPSRTADIERVLTIGVQGPKALHVVVVRGQGYER